MSHQLIFSFLLYFHQVLLYEVNDFPVLWPVAAFGFGTRAGAICRVPCGGGQVAASVGSKTGEIRVLHCFTLFWIEEKVKNYGETR